MAALVQSLGTAEATTGVAPPVITTTGTTTLGNIIVLIAVQSGTRTWGGVTDTAGNTYTRLAGTSTGGSVIFVAPVTSVLNSGQTITTSYGSVSNVVTAAAEFTPYVVAADATGTATGTSTSGSPLSPAASITNVSAKALLLSSLRVASSLVDALGVTEDVAWTNILVRQHTTQSVALSLAYKEVTSVSTVNHAPTLNVTKVYLDQLLSLGSPVASTTYPKNLLMLEAG